MLLNNLTCDGKSESDSAEEIISAFFEVIETVEDARQVFLCDPDALIFHSDQNFVAVSAQVDFYIAASWTELDGVIHQRHECAHHPF